MHTVCVLQVNTESDYMSCSPSITYRLTVTQTSKPNHKTGTVLSLLLVTLPMELVATEVMQG